MVRKAITALTTISTSNTTQRQHDHQHHAPPTTHHLSTRYPSLKEITPQRDPDLVIQIFRKKFICHLEDVKLGEPSVTCFGRWLSGYKQFYP